MDPLVIRADANTQIGTGHVMRCLALAQAWQDKGGEAVFVTAFSMPEGIRARLANEGFNVIQLDSVPGSLTDAEQTAQLAHQAKAQWLVVDGYHFGSEYQKMIKDNHLKLMVVDDYGHAKHYYADIVLNQNIHADESFYSNREPYSHLLLGIKHLLLRREFWSWHEQKARIPAIAKKILVTMGGSNPDNFTYRIMTALSYLNIENLEVFVVIGSGNPHKQMLKNVCKNLIIPTKLFVNVSNMPELMASVNLAISAGGSTIWELAFMGVPTIGCARAKQEEMLLRTTAQMGITINFGVDQNLGPEEIGSEVIDLAHNRCLRTEMCQIGQVTVDGYGSERVINKLLEVS